MLITTTTTTTTTEGKLELLFIVYCFTTVLLLLWFTCVCKHAQISLLFAAVHVRQRLVEDFHWESSFTTRTPTLLFLLLLQLLNLPENVRQRLPFVLSVHLGQVHLPVEGLDGRLRLGVLTSSVVGLNYGPLLSGGPLEGGHYQPAALAVANVGADLADDGRVGEAVQVVVLHLEELANLQHQRLHGAVLGPVRPAGEVQRQPRREDKGVEGGLVLDDGLVALQAVGGEVARRSGRSRLRLGDHVQRLAVAGDAEALNRGNLEGLGFVYEGVSV